MEEDKATVIFKKYYKEWENNPLRMESGYDYEKTYAEMMQKVEQEVLQISVGEIPETTLFCGSAKSFCRSRGDTGNVERLKNQC